jgi:hypothetical protein
MDAIAEILQIGPFLRAQASPIGPADGAVVYRMENAGSVPMRVFATAAVIALLTGPAYAQGPNINLIPELASKTPEEKEADAQREKAYKDSLRKIPDAKVSSDPWGNVRSAETPKPSAPAKPRTKTGSTAN